MAMTIREAFDKGTETFNAHDIDGFTSVLADDCPIRTTRTACPPHPADPGENCAVMSDHVKKAPPL